MPENSLSKYDDFLSLIFLTVSDSSGEDTTFVWKFSSRGRSMMQQKLDFYFTMDYSHARRDWNNQDTRMSNLKCNVSTGTLYATALVM